MLVVSGLTISLCIVVLAYKSLHMRSKMVCWTAALIAVLVISAVRTGDVRLLESVLLIIAVTDIDKQRLFKLIATALAASIAVVVLASLCGWIWNKDVIPNDYLVFAWGLHIRIRLGGLLTCLVVLTLYVSWNHRAWPLSVAVTVLLALFSKIMLSSNTAMAIMLAYCLASVLGHLFTGQLSPLFTKRVRVLTACLLALLVTVGMLYLMAAYDGGNPVHEALNDLLHSRLFWGKYYRTNGGFTILGRPYLSVSSYHQGTMFESLDSGIMYMGGVFGLLPLLSASRCLHT